MMDLLRDLWEFLKVRKKFWLAPIIIILLLLGALTLCGGEEAKPLSRPWLPLLFAVVIVGFTFIYLTKTVIENIEAFGGPLGIFNIPKVLEIAMNNGTASGLLGLHPDDPVRIEFAEQTK